MLKFLLTIFAFLGFFWALDTGINPKFRKQMINYLLNLEKISKNDRIIELNRSFLHKFERYYFIEYSEFHRILWTGIITSISTIFIMVLLSKFLPISISLEGFLVFGFIFGMNGAFIIYLLSNIYMLYLCLFPIMFFFILFISLNNLNDINPTNIYKNFTYLYMLAPFFIIGPVHTRNGTISKKKLLINGIILLVLLNLGHLILLTILGDFNLSNSFFNFSNSFFDIILILFILFLIPSTGTLFIYYYNPKKFVSPIQSFVFSLLSIIIITLALNWFFPQIVESFIFDLKNIGWPILGYLLLNLFADTISLVETHNILSRAVSISIVRYGKLLLLDFFLSLIIFLIIPLSTGNFQIFLNAIMYGERLWLIILIISTFSTSLLLYAFIFYSTFMLTFLNLIRNYFKLEEYLFIKKYPFLSFGLIISLISIILYFIYNSLILVLSLIS